MPPNNTAAWLPAKNVKPLKIGPAPYTQPSAHEIVVKNSAVAINPVDWAKQQFGNLLLGHIRYPFILGGDVAGEVIEVGGEVKKFNVGDRAIGLAAAAAPASNKPSEGAFQHYTVLREHLAATIPEWMPYEDACVLPLCLVTAAYGLFHKNFLALSLPIVPPKYSKDGDRVLIVTGGASSVGTNAIQLAVSAGYQVYTTASPKNFDFVTKLGAARVFDYHSTTLVEDILTALNGKDLVGAYTVGNGAVEACTTVLRRHPRTTNKFIAFAGSGLDGLKEATTGFQKTTLMAGLVFWMFKRMVVSYLTGVKFKFVDTKDVFEPDGVVGRVFGDFLSQALAAKQFIPAPDPLIVGNGLESIQDAMDVHREGVSAKKVVVLL